MTRLTPLQIHAAEVEAGIESADIDAVMQQQNAMTYALDLEHKLAQERADHAKTRMALARAYDTIAKVRGAVAGRGDS